MEPTWYPPTPPRLLPVRFDEKAILEMADLIRRRGAAMTQIDWPAPAAPLPEHAGGYRASPRQEPRLQKRPPPGPAWPLRAPFARLAWAWCTGRLRRIEDRRIVRMLPTDAYALAETSERMWRRVSRLRPNLYAEIQDQHHQDWLVRMDEWQRDGARAPRPVHLPGPPKRISM